MSEQNDSILIERIENSEGVIEIRYTNSVFKNKERIEHPHGITEEKYSDGSRRFSGPGGGVLWIPSTGEAVISTEGEIGSEAMERLLAAQFPPRPIEFSDLNNYKEESRLMLEALRERKAQFFRDIADSIMPKPSLLKTMREVDKSTAIRDSEVFDSIQKAAMEARGKPSFKAIHALYRDAVGKPSDPARDLKRKLIRLGFEWLTLG